MIGFLILLRMMREAAMARHEWLVRTFYPAEQWPMQLEWHENIVRAVYGF
jgi:hypothetical protein